MNKKMLIGVGVVVLGYVIYKKYYAKDKKPTVAFISKPTPEVAYAPNPATGKPMVIVKK